LAITATGGSSLGTWNITGGTPNGGFQVVESGANFSDVYDYSFDSSGADSRNFKTGGNPSGSLTVTDLTTGASASCSF